MAVFDAVSLCARLTCFGCGVGGTALCGRCRVDLVPPGRDEAVHGVDRVLVPWGYEGAARDLVLALKLRQRRDAAVPLAQVVAASVRSAGTVAEVVAWVPCRRRDARVRGFDHAEVIARGVAESLGLPPVGLLRRTSARPDQTSLTASQRRTNLVGAFASRAAPRAVLLVDDLVTTGATGAACAQALRGAGVSHVDLAAPCRA